MEYSPLFVHQNEDPTFNVVDRLEAIKQLIGSRFCILAGAGISFDSGLPLASAVAGEILDSIGLQEFEKEELMLALSPDHHTNLSWHDFLRFEDIFQAVQRFHDPSLKILDALFARGSPSSTHHALALHLSKGNPVFTTNFDTLLEQVAPNIPVLINESDYQEPDLLDKPFIGKLHGTVGSLNLSSELPCATIDRILNDFAANQHKWALFARVIKQMPLVVIGYSGSDDFDVMFALRQIASTFPIVWINHSKDMPQEFVANWEECLSGVPPKFMSNKLWTFIHFSFKNHPCRNLNQCYFIQGETKRILAKLGFSIHIPSDLPKRASVPKLEITPDSACLIRAQLFSRLNYGSWALKNLEQYLGSENNISDPSSNSQKTSEKHFRANEIKAQNYFEMFRLADAEAVFHEIVATQNTEMAIEYKLKIAEITAFRIVIRNPLKHIANALPDLETFRNRLNEQILEITEFLRSYDSENSNKFQWAWRRTKALQLIAAHWGKEEVDSMPSLLSKLELASSSFLIDPFLLGVLYLVYWNNAHRTRSHSFSEESHSKLVVDSVVEELYKNDALRLMFPVSIYGTTASQIPHTPSWRQMTWTPIVEPTNALNYASNIFEFTDNHIWSLACDLVLWDDELRSGWRDYSYLSILPAVFRLQKAGAVGFSLVFGAFLPIGGDINPDDLDMAGEKALQALKSHTERSLPTIAKFFHFDIGNIICLQEFLEEDLYQSFFNGFARSQERRKPKV